MGGGGDMERKVLREPNICPAKRRILVRHYFCFLQGMIDLPDMSLRTRSAVKTTTLHSIASTRKGI